MKSAVVVVGGQKGGTGKSTVAQNLAVALALDGGDVLVLDTDTPQITSSKWSDERAAQGISPLVHCAVRDGAGVGAAIDDFRKRYSHVIVDTGGADSEELRAALVRADVFVSPVEPAQAALWTIQKVDNLARLAASINERMRRLVVINGAPSRKAPEVAATLAFFKDFPGLELSKAIIYRRIAYSRALAEGRGVLEYSPLDEQAAEEIRTLYAEIYKNG